MSSKSIVESILIQYSRDIGPDNVFFTVENYGMSVLNLKIYKDYHTKIDNVAVYYRNIESAMKAVIEIILIRQSSAPYKFIIIGINQVSEICQIDPIAPKEYRINYSVTIVD